MIKTTHYFKDQHLEKLISDPFYKNLVLLRNRVAISCDEYFQKHSAPRVDLFLVAKGVSSPMGKGSDSLPIPFTFGNQEVFLVDSAQFGMEPLVLHNFDMVYCYLPSFRGEDADNRHLNQFYHCEAELRGGLDKAMSIAEGLVKHIIAQAAKAAENNEFEFKEANFARVATMTTQPFPQLAFDEAHDLLIKNGHDDLVEKRPYGRVITNRGEHKLTELVNNGKTPIWLTHYDRDVVPFYQKPNPNNPEQVLNADLILPRVRGSFAGEVLGLGQRQDSVEELKISMKRQEVHHQGSYDWYLELRKNRNYQTTSGFGMGVERLLAWLLNLDSIIDTAIYPVLKNEQITY